MLWRRGSQQRMMGGESSRFRIHIGRADGTGLRSNNIPEILIFQSGLHNQRQVMGRSIVVFIRHAAGIDKMCIGTA